MPFSKRLLKISKAPAIKTGTRLTLQRKKQHKFSSFSRQTFNCYTPTHLFYKLMDNKKTSTGNNNTSTGSNNTQQPAGNDSKPAASNQTVAPEPAQSEPAQPEAPKNEYVAPGWIFYGSKAGNGMSGEQKAYIDSLVKQWTDGSISDSYLAEQIAHKMKEEWGLSLNSVGISGDDRCIYPSKNEIPNYNEALAESYGFYNFTGLYTKGEYDEYGYLICYMWGVGIF